MGYLLCGYKLIVDEELFLLRVATGGVEFLVGGYRGQRAMASISRMANGTSANWLSTIPVVPWSTPWNAFAPGKTNGLAVEGNGERSYAKGVFLEGWVTAKDCERQ